MEEVAEDRTSEKRSGKEEKTIKKRRKGGTFTLSDYQSTCCCRGREGERERWNEWRERRIDSERENGDGLAYTSSSGAGSGCCECRSGSGFPLRLQRRCPNP